MSPLHSVEIGGHSFEFSDWSTTKGISILTWVAKKAGSPIAAFAAVGLSSDDEDKAEEKLKNEGDKMFLDAIQMALTDLSSNDINTHLKAICEDGVLIDGKKVNYDLHYKKKIGTLMKVAQANLEYQYDDFLGELLDLVTTQKGPVLGMNTAPEAVVAQ